MHLNDMAVSIGHADNAMHRRRVDNGSVRGYRNDGHLAPIIGIGLPTKFNGFFERLETFGQPSSSHNDFLLMVDAIHPLELGRLRRSKTNRQQNRNRRKKQISFHIVVSKKLKINLI